MSVIITVPATSANLGIGYDCLGMAVSLYSRFTFDRADELTITGCPEKYRNEDNLVYRSFVLALEHWGEKPFPIAIDIDTSIPVSRGLGSSSTCTVAGIMGAAALTGRIVGRAEAVSIATQMEGHPDNVAPALLGGLTSSVFEDGVVYSVKRDVDESLCFAAIVPDYKLLTEAARAALPKEVTHKDAVYNLSRAALIPAAFCEGRHDLLAIATEDKLHQPYRMPLMPGSKEVFDMARLCGAKAVYVSGAGSTVMAVAEKANAEKFYSKLEKGLELLEGLDGCEAFTLLRLDADNTGATVE